MRRASRPAAKSTRRNSRTGGGSIFYPIHTTTSIDAGDGNDRVFFDTTRFATYVTIALGTGDIYDAVETMRERGVTFQDTIDTYYDGIDARLPGHGENVNRLRADRG